MQWVSTRKDMMTMPKDRFHNFLSSLILSLLIHNNYNLHVYNINTFMKFDQERLKIRKMKLDADAKEAEILANTGLNSISEE